MDNSERQIVKIMKEICGELHINLKLLFTDWIMQLSYQDKNMFITGYRFPNNNSPSARLCDDKSALSCILADGGLRVIPHDYFMSPKNKYGTPAEDPSDLVKALLDRYGTVVCKLNTGTGGRHVFKAETEQDIKNALLDIFPIGDLAVCPYYPFDNEYRIIILNHRAELVYKKEISHVTGDGQKTLSELTSSLPGFDASDCIYQPEDVLPAGTKVCTSWKHNLALGARAVALEDAALQEKLEKIAVQAADLVRIGFASVDIVEMHQEFYILEINSGIVMEKFSAQSEENYAVTKRIYQKAVTLYFECAD